MRLHPSANLEVCPDLTPFGGVAHLDLLLDALEGSDLLQSPLVKGVRDKLDLLVNLGNGDLLEGVHPAGSPLDLLPDLAQAVLGVGDL